MDGAIKRFDDGKFRIIGMSPSYISTGANSGNVGDDDKSQSHHQQAQPKPPINFNPTLNEPLNACPLETKKAILSTLSADEMTVLRYYLNGISQVEIANKMNLSTASVGRILKSTKLKFSIRTSKSNEALALWHLVYRFKLPQQLVSKIKYWIFDNYGGQCKKYKMLVEEYFRILREKRELRKLSEAKNAT